MKRFLLLLAALAWAATAEASPSELVIGSGIYAGTGSPPAYTGPGDIVSFTAFYSCSRAYSAAVAAATGQLCKYRNTATAETCDTLATTAGGPGNVTNCSGSSSGDTLAVFCAESAGSCALVEQYDQTGGSRPISQSTTADQPSITVSCLNATPCMVLGSSSITLASASSFTPATGVATLYAVSWRNAETNVSTMIEESGSSSNRLQARATHAQWTLNGSTTIVPTANDSVWHAGIGVVNSSSSFINVDGSAPTGTITNVSTAGVITVAGGNSVSTEQVEEGFIDNVAESTTVATNLCKNAQAYYGAGSFGATC